jgi:hypothetical protein
MTMRVPPLPAMARARFASGVLVTTPACVTLRSATFELPLSASSTITLPWLSTATLNGARKRAMLPVPSCGSMAASLLPASVVTVPSGVTLRISVSSTTYRLPCRSPAIALMERKRATPAAPSTGVGRNVPVTLPTRAVATPASEIVTIRSGWAPYSMPLAAPYSWKPPFVPIVSVANRVAWPSAANRLSSTVPGPAS